MPASYTADTLLMLAGIQHAELRGKGATRFLAHRAMEPGHLLHSALTHPLGGKTRQLKSRHPFVPAAQLTVHLTTTTTYVRRGGRITNGMRSGWTTLRDSASAPALPEWLCQEQLGSGLTAFTPVSDFSAPVCTNGLWPPLRLVSSAGFRWWGAWGPDVVGGEAPCADTKCSGRR